MAESFAEQTAGEQRKLLQVLVQKACWKNGALQASLREPFEALRVARGEVITKRSERAGQQPPTSTTANVTEIRAPES